MILIKYKSAGCLQIAEICEDLVLRKVFESSASMETFRDISGFISGSTWCGLSITDDRFERLE